LSSTNSGIFCPLWYTSGYGYSVCLVSDVTETAARKHIASKLFSKLSNHVQVRN